MNPLKIAIIELEDHAEVLHNFCTILHPIYPKNNITKPTIFVAQHIFNEIKNEININAFEWFIMPNNQTISSFLTQHYNYLNTHFDLILFNTVQTNFKQYCKIPPFTKPATILNIHNLNAFFKPFIKKIKLPKNLFFLRKTIAHLLQKTILQQDEYYQKKFLATYIQHFAVLDEQLHHYAQNFIQPPKLIPTLAGACASTQFQKTQPTAALHLTIPGAIDRRRKNYQHVIQALNILLPQLTLPLHLTLLGKPTDQYSTHIIKQLNALQQQFPLFTLQTFKNRVPKTIFNQVMQQTDLILSPIHIHTQYKIYAEQYGVSKVSGSVLDTIHYGKCSIFPAQHPVNKLLAPFTFTYKNPAHMADIILQCTQNKNLITQKKPFIEKMQTEYSPQNLQTKYSQIFQDIINTSKLQ